MAYRLRRKESVAHGLRRLATKELRVARQQLPKQARARSEAIHEARKSVKKVRAIMHLIAADDGRLGRAEKRIRAVNQQLSEVRDADVVMSTLEQLSSRHRGLIDQRALRRMRAALLARRRKVRQSADRDGVWTDLRDDLRKLERLAKRWEPSHSGFSALSDGIRLTFRRGRNALASARKSGRATDFHEWRKQVKALWYHLRLLEDAGKLGPDIEALHHAEAWLGDDHDLVVLCAELMKKNSRCQGLIDLDRVRLASDADGCDLRKRAIAAVGPMYRRRTRVYMRELERRWTSWRRGPSAAARTRAST